MRSLAVFTNGRVGALCACLGLCFALGSLGAATRASAQDEDEGYEDEPKAAVEATPEAADGPASKPNEPGAPVITAHSDLTFAVYKGDSVTVEVQAKGKNLTYKWIKSNATICREATCEIDTSEWGLGTHKVTLVVFNELGSLFIKGKIRVLTVPAGYVPNKVRAPLTQASAAIEAVAADDLVVATTSGRGFSYHGRKVQVVGPTLRSLEWNEKLRTQSASTMRFGRGGMEEHLLGEQSAVYLVKGATERRAIVLRHGVLRSRQLGGSPRWSIVVDPWMQIDTDERGDVLVERVVAEDGKEEVVTVTTLRGNARVYRWTDEAGNAGKALAVPQGLEVRFTRATPEDQPRLAQPDAARMQRLFKMLTPQLLPGENPAQWGNSWTLLGEERPAKLSDALKTARSALAARDYMRALEALASFKSDMHQSYEASLALGEAAVGLSLLETATTVLEQAVELKPEASEPHFLMGYIALGGKRWQQAITHFEAAQDLDHPKTQEIAYYLGVARMRLGQRLSARQAFTHALWESGSPEIESSARSFLGQVQEDGWLDVRMGAGVFNDSNVFRSDSIDVTTLGDGSIDATKSAGYMGSAGFTVYGFRNENAYVSVAFDIERRDYLESSLKVIGRLDQRLGLGFGLAFGGGDLGENGIRVAPALKVDLGAVAATTSLGDERAIDQVGTSLSFGMPRWLGLALRLESMLNIDPLPGRDDLLDPLADELVAAGDRSSRDITYGFGLVPIDGTRWRLGLDVESSTTLLRDELARSDDRNDLKIGLSVRFATSLRQHFDLGISQRSRTYPESEDSRKDSLLRIGLGWRWYYTPVLYHVLDVTQESQSSNRDASAYSRQILGLRIGLDF